MPYIYQYDRKVYKEDLDSLCKTLEEDSYPAGHVIYILYMIVARWFKDNPCYSTIAAIRGCLIGTLAEFDRRIAAPYEDKKIKENGDVDLSYPPFGVMEGIDPDCQEDCCKPWRAEDDDDEGDAYREGDVCERKGCCGPRDCPCENPGLDTRGGA